MSELYKRKRQLALISNSEKEVGLNENFTIAEQS